MKQRQRKNVSYVYRPGAQMLLTLTEARRLTRRYNYTTSTGVRLQHLFPKTVPLHHAYFVYLIASCLRTTQYDENTHRYTVTYAVPNTDIVAALIEADKR